MITFLSQMGHDRYMFHRIAEMIPDTMRVDQIHAPAHDTCIDSSTSLLVAWSAMSGETRRITSMARRMDIRVAYMEHGYLTGTIQIDPQGVNAGSSICDTITADMLMRMPVDADLFQKMMAEPFLQRQFPSGAEVKTSDTDDGKPLPERYVFVPLQVHDDSNLTMYGSEYTNERIICEANDYAEQNDMVTVVKEHPSDYERIDYQPFRDDYPSMVWLRTTPTAEVIRGATEVWTINSSVGVEGLRQGKTVRVTGQTAFKRIANIYSGVNEEIVARWLYWMRWHYLIHTNPFREDGDGNVAAAHRVMAIRDGLCPWLDCFG